MAGPIPAGNTYCMFKLPLACQWHCDETTLDTIVISLLTPRAGSSGTFDVNLSTAIFHRQFKEIKYEPGNSDAISVCLSIDRLIVETSWRLLDEAG